MAPEAAQGARTAHASTDVFAFGVMAYEVLSGRAPFDVAPLTLALARQPLPLPPALPGDATLAACVLACLAEDPVRRPSMQAVRAALG